MPSCVQVFILIVLRHEEGCEDVLLVAFLNSNSPVLYVHLNLFVPITVLRNYLGKNCYVASIKVRELYRILHDIEYNLLKSLSIKSHRALVNTAEIRLYS